MKPRKSTATHPGLKVKKSRNLTLFASTRKKKKTRKPVMPTDWVAPFAQA